MLLDLEQLLADERPDPRLVAQDRPQLSDPLHEILVLVLDPLALERGQRAQAEVEDRLGLDLGELELLHQALARSLRVGRGPDQRDHGVQVVQRDQVTQKNVGSRFRLAQLVLQPASDDLALEVKVVAEQVAERECPRHAVDESDRVVAPGRLQRRVLVELVQHDLGDRLALQVDLDAHPGLVGEILDVGNLRKITLSLTRSAIFLITPESPPLFTLIGQLVDDDRFLPSTRRRSSKCVRARMMMRPRPVRYPSRMPSPYRRRCLGWENRDP